MSAKAPLLKPSEKRNHPQPRMSTMVHKKESRFEQLKHVVRSGLQTAFEVGAALLEIRDSKLYQHEFETFEEFCESEFQIVRRRAYQLIDAAQVKAALPPAMSAMVDNERQARALSPVPVEKREEVLTKAAERGPVTAKAIKETAKAVNASKVTNAVILDKTGYAIPESILEDWNRATDTGKQWLQTLSGLRSELKAAFEDQDLILARITNTTLADLNNVYTSLKCIVPYAVCASCQGHQRKKCDLCKHLGFLDKFSWESFVPAETRKIREKSK